MNDKMNELVQFSDNAGKLVLEKVAGEVSKKVEYENEVQAKSGIDRTMYCYVPETGCPDPKQCQVLMVLRDGSDEDSAQKVMENLKLKGLAEDQNFILVFPNPTNDGWNYKNDSARENDIDFIVRCFDSLKASSSHVSGFNGMIYYLPASPCASAMIMTMAALNPLNVSAMMVSEFPDDYTIPAEALNVEVAAWSSNPVATEYIKNANETNGSGEEDKGDITYYGKNPNVRLIVSDSEINAETVLSAWDKLFSISRRWRNDTYGTYQHRTAFTERGFVAHVKDSSLGVNDGYEHTWYEYIPPQLRGTDEKVPLLFNFHGVNCVPLYGAEQSNWHDIADREGFIVVYPAPAKSKCWNIVNESTLISDFDFVLALIEHMKDIHPIDETRIYVAGFSMGGMMTHALSGAYPDIFAAGAPCNAFNFGYYMKPAGLFTPFMKGIKDEELENVSYAKVFADEKKAKYDYRMPIFQNVGFNDTLISSWPLDAETEDIRMDTIKRWMEYNNISSDDLFDSKTLSGLSADESFYEDEEERFFHQRWLSGDEGSPSLYEMMFVKRMPHAILPIQTEYAWEFIKKFSRMKDGTLKIN